jgi:hypothetical protein
MANPHNSQGMTLLSLLFCLLILISNRSTTANLPVVLFNFLHIQEANDTVNPTVDSFTTSDIQKVSESTDRFTTPFKMGDFFIPSQQADFRELLNGLAFKKSIQGVEQTTLDSASQITPEQFALLRVYFPIRQGRRKFSRYCTDTLHLKDIRESAREPLNQSPSYNRLLSALGDRLDIDELKGNDEE